MDLAFTSKCFYRHGAIVVKNGNIIATGINFYRNKPGDNIDPDGISVHAEEAAIRKVSASKLRGATVYVARHGRCSRHAMSRPCKRCHKALLKAGVKKVVYTD